MTSGKGGNADVSFLSRRGKRTSACSPCPYVDVAVAGAAATAASTFKCDKHQE